MFSVDYIYCFIRLYQYNLFRRENQRYFGMVNYQFICWINFHKKCRLFDRIDIKYIKIMKSKAIENYSLFNLKMVFLLLILKMIITKNHKFMNLFASFESIHLTQLDCVDLKILNKFFLNDVSLFN